MYRPYAVILKRTTHISRGGARRTSSQRYLENRPSVSPDACQKLPCTTAGMSLMADGITAIDCCRSRPLPRDDTSQLDQRSAKLDGAMTMDQGWPLKQSLLHEGGCRAILRWRSRLGFLWRSRTRAAISWWWLISLLRLSANNTS